VQDAQGVIGFCQRPQQILTLVLVECCCIVDCARQCTVVSTHANTLIDSLM